MFLPFKSVDMGEMTATGEALLGFFDGEQQTEPGTVSDRFDQKRSPVPFHVTGLAAFCSFTPSFA